MPDTLKPSKLKSQSSEQRKVYRRAKQEELGSSCSKVLNSLTVWGEQIFRKVYRLRELHLIVDGEVTGWCSRNLSHQLSGSSRCGNHMLVLDLKLLHSTNIYQRVELPSHMVTLSIFLMNCQTVLQSALHHFTIHQ